MRRPAATFTATGILLLLTACGGTSGQAVPSDVASPVASASAANPGSAGADVSPAFAWTFGDEATTVAGDVELELAGGHEFAGNAVAFDGRTGFAASVEPAPIDTTASFSVSAWVSLADPPEYAAAVSQVGAEAAAFYLGIGESTWDFAMKDADTNEPGHTIRAKADVALVDLDEWFNLVGVHDAEAGEIKLYVNGELAAAVAFDGAWQAQGELTIGRSQANFAQADFWPGLIASVAIFGETLTPEQIRSIYETTEPAEAPPAIDSTASALRGTWDYVNDEAGREVILNSFAGLVDSADEVVTRIGFDGNDWWQGFLFDGALFLLDGVPEGDGGSFILVPGEPVIAMTGAHGAARIGYEYAINGDSLTLTAVEQCSLSGVEPICTDDRSKMDPVMLLVTDQTFTRSGDDPRY